MALNIEQKKAIVADVAAIAADARSAVAVEYRGLAVDDSTELRAKAREAGVHLRVVKNTLARKAVAGTDFACLSEVLVGPLMLAFSRTEPGAAARVVVDFAKDHEQLVIKAGAIGGKLLAASEVPNLAKMPTYDQAISMLMAVVRAPLDKLARTLAEPHAKLTRTIAAVRDQKQPA